MDIRITKLLKLCHIVFVTIFLVNIVASCNEEAPSYKAEVINVRTNLNVRESPDVQSKILGKLYKGDIVEVYSEDHNDWVKIRKDDITGYVNSTYLYISSNIDVPLVSSSDREETNFLSSIFDSSVGSSIKTVFYIILGIIGLILFALIFKALLYIVGLIVSIVLTGLGGGLIGGFIGLVLTGFDFDAAEVWRNYGFYIGLVMGLIMAITKPKEFMFQMFKSSSSSGGGSQSVSNKNTESSDQPRERSVYDRDAYCYNCSFYNSISHECYRTTTPYEVKGYERACPYYK